MHDFTFKNNELYCEGIRVRRIAKDVGTPFYLYSYKTLVDHLKKIQRAFAKIDPIICFAMKSNDNLSVIKSLVDQGAGCDIVSGGELQKAVIAKADPEKIVYASVGKTEEEILYALKVGILLFNVESVSEIEAINRIARKYKRKAPIAIRINPNVEAATHEAITTGTLKNKFGIDLTTARDLLRKRKKYRFVQIKGLHMHIGSQIVKREPFINAIKKVISFVEELRSDGIHLEYLNIGGGLGIIYKDEKPQTAKDFAEAVVPYLEKTALKIIMEPGRFITGNAGILVTKVLYTKDNGFKKFLIVDAGMNDLIRPALYKSYHEIVPVVANPSRKMTFDVVGPICESDDFLGKERKLPAMKKGELLAVMSAGAYGFTMSSNYNARRRVPEVMVKGRQYNVIREREKFQDLIAGEKIANFIKTLK